jgi:hypothetical protein
MTENIIKSDPKKDKGAIVASSSQSKSRRVLNAFLFQYVNGLVLLVLLGVLYAGYLFLLRPKYTAIRGELNASVAAKEKEFEDLQNYLSVLNNYYRSYENVDKEKVKKIDGMLPTGRSTEDLFAVFEQLAAEKGLVIKEIAIAPEEVAKTSKKNQKAVSSLSGIGVTTITLDFVGGTYPILKDLLATLETSQRLFDVESVDYNPGNSSLTLKLKAYMFLADK